MHFWDAILASHTEVRIIHGRSGGRAAVHKRLREIPGAQLPARRDEPRRDGRLCCRVRSRIDQSVRCGWAGMPGPRLPFDAVVNRALRRIPYGPAAARVFTEPVNDHLDAGWSEGQWRNGAASARTACGPDLIPSLSRRSQVAADPHAGRRPAVGPFECRRRTASGPR